MKKIAKFTILFILMLNIFGCSSGDSTISKKEKPLVVVTSFTLFEIANRLLENSVEVKKLIPDGREVHSFIPTPKTISLIYDAKIFIFNGLGLEPWLKQDYENQLDMSKYINILNLEDEHHHEHSNGKDPHYWLDSENMVKITEVLSEKFQEEFPKYKKQITKNEQIIKNEYLNLAQEYTKKLSTCRKKEIVLNHNAFGYLAHKYNFKTHTVTGLSPDEQASAKKMNEISNLVKKDNIKIIFFESFVSPKVSQTIAQETGAKILSLHTLANISKDEVGKTYSTLMRENLKNLAIAMECE